jgi:hypothetical protein
MLLPPPKNRSGIILPSLNAWMKNYLETLAPGKGWKQGQVPPQVQTPYICFHGQPSINSLVVGNVVVQATVRMAIAARGPERKLVSVGNYEDGEEAVFELADSILPYFDSVSCVTDASLKIHISGFKRLNDIHLTVPEPVGNTIVNYIHIGGLYLVTCHHYQA